MAAVRLGKKVKYVGQFGPTQFDEVGNLIGGSVEIWGIKNRQIETLSVE